jgi:hypothetical protein
MKFYKIRSGAAELLHPDRQTDRHDEANCKSAYKTKRNGTPESTEENSIPFRWALSHTLSQ